MAETMMILGDYVFSLEAAAFERLARTRAWRWQAVERVGRRPALQYLGPGEESIALEGRIYPQFRGGLGQIEAMKAAAEQGVPLLLVDGQGRPWGRYVILRVAETRPAFLPRGVPLRQDFTLSLRYYGEDSP